MISVKAAIKTIEKQCGYRFTSSRVIHRGCSGSTLVTCRFYSFETEQGLIRTYGTAELRLLASSLL